MILFQLLCNLSMFTEILGFGSLVLNRIAIGIVLFDSSVWYCWAVSLKLAKNLQRFQLFGKSVCLQQSPLPQL